MKSIRFSKLNGQGNDFILIDAVTTRVVLKPSEIRDMCDRHFGIGADGLILVRESKRAHFYMDYYNQDGSKAEMCGNGIRCMARFLLENKLIDTRRIEIDTPAGVKLVTAGDFKKNAYFKVDMGLPEFQPSKIPVNLEKADNVLNYRLKSQSGIFNINCVSMGNPHCVIFIKPDTDLAEIPLEKWGSELENHDFFPNKTNVEIVKYKCPWEIDVRVWERGVGETLACGTGACAAGVVCIETGIIKYRELSVNMPGGMLNIIWEHPEVPVFLKGPVKHSYDGTYYL